MGTTTSFQAAPAGQARSDATNSCTSPYKEQVATLDPASIEFTPYLWHTLVDHADIATDGTISFTFRDGAKQTQPIGK